MDEPEPERWSGESGDSGAAVAAARRPRKVGDLMRRDFVTIQPQENLLEALQLMRLARLRHLLVSDGENLLGLLSYRDLQDRSLDWTDEGERRSLRESLSSAAVQHVMVEAPFYVSPEMPVEDAAARLYHLRLGCLPVIEAGKRGRPDRLVGIVTETDLLRAAYDPRYRAPARERSRQARRSRARSEA